MAFTAKSMLPARRGPVAWIISSVDGHIYTDILAAPRQHPPAVRFAVTYRGRSMRQNPRWRSPPRRPPESFRIIRRASLAGTLYDRDRVLARYGFAQFSDRRSHPRWSRSRACWTVAASKLRHG